MSAKSEPMLQVRGVNQVFRSGFWMRPAQVLHGVSLEVPRGAIFGFLGANGAGKTTLIHLIAGLRKPAKGEIRIAGLPVSDPEARARIGYLPERPYFHEHLTGEGTLRYFGELSGLSRDRIEARIPVVLEAVSMERARGRELKTYSKGMLQRIGIAQAILHEPELLILDEPMSGLDPVGRKEMRELILKLASEGKTIFFSTHVIPDVEAICDEVAVIEAGRITKRGSVSGLLAEEAPRTELLFTGVRIDDARGAAPFESIRTIPDGVRALLKPGSDVNAALSSLISSGARILSVSPIRPTLESFFERSDS